MDKNLLQRIISGAVYGLLIFLCTTHLGSVYLKEFFNINVKQEYLYLSLIVFLIIVGAWEAIRIMKFGDSWWKWLVYPIGFLVFYKFAARFLNHDFYFLFNLQEILGILLIAIASFTLFKYPNE
ncbi:MAG: phosphatidate cytidylyltransferase, partial [Riemerella sp.]|nr:phosphatidate cytidylyltransferase [Riemerella sp.]